MKVELDVKITAKDLSNFMMYHNYAGFQGKLGVVLGIVAIIVSIVTYGNVEQIYTFAYFAFGIIFILYTPLNIGMRSKKQFLLTPVFKDAIHYVIDEQGIQSVIGNQHTEATWENVFKVVANSKYIFIYTSKVNATILPRTEIGDQYDQIIEIVKNKVDLKRLKIK